MVKRDGIATKFLSINILFLIHYKQKQLPHFVILSFSLSFFLSLYLSHYTFKLFSLLFSNVLMSNEMHSSYNQFYSTVFYLLYMFLTNLVVHHHQHCIMYCITQYNRYNRAGQSSCFEVVSKTVSYLQLGTMNL